MNASIKTQFETLAGLFDYPESGFVPRLQAAQQTFSQTSAATSLGLFGSRASALSPEEREELYAATFEVTPACVLYVSIHLFGEENFKRGAFMAALHARYRETGFTPSGELPDHLGNLLRYAARVEEQECRELAEFCLLGPLHKMLAALDAQNPYHALLAAAGACLQEAFPGLRPAMSPLEQMRAHGGQCAVSSAGCNCSPVPEKLEPVSVA